MSYIMKQFQDGTPSLTSASISSYMNYFMKWCRAWWALSLYRSRRYRMYLQGRRNHFKSMTISHNCHGNHALHHVSFLVLQDVICEDPG